MSNTLSVLPNIVYNGGKIAREISNNQQTTSYSTLSTVKDVITGKLITDVVVDHGLSYAIKPAANWVGSRAESGILKLEKEVVLDRLVARAVDSVLTQENLRSICSLAGQHISAYAATQYETFKVKMEKDQSYVGIAYNRLHDGAAVVKDGIDQFSNKICENFKTAQAYLLENTSYNGRRGGLYVALGAATCASIATSCPLLLAAGGLSVFARVWNSVTGDEDSILSNQNLDIANRIMVRTLLINAREKMEKEGYAISDEEFKHVRECLDSLIVEGKINLSPLQKALTNRAVEQLRSEIRKQLIVAITPVARWAIQQSAVIAKKTTEVGTNYLLTKTCKTLVNPLVQSATLGLIASYLTELSPPIQMALVVAPTVYSYGSAGVNYLYNKCCKTPSEEELRKEKLSRVFEKTLQMHINLGLRSTFEWYTGDESMEETAFMTAKGMAKPIADILATSILQGKDNAFADVLAESFQKAFAS